ncbi:MAG: type III pantothenate kinase [Elusimicrobiota bacterium]
MKKVLLIDIGNTNIVFGLCDEDKDFESGYEVLRIPTVLPGKKKEYKNYILDFLNQQNILSKDIKSVVIASVVPNMDAVFKNIIDECFECGYLFIDDKLNLGMRIRYEKPSNVGADRIVNAVAGRALYGKPILVVDFGTAVTVDVVSMSGEYVGGAISQGLGGALEYLGSKTAKLPKIEMKIPKDVIGKTTEESMLSGIYYSFLGGIKYIISMIKQKNEYKNAKVIATGGYAELYKNETDVFDFIDTELTLKGLKLIYDKVRIQDAESGSA